MAEIKAGEKLCNECANWNDLGDERGECRAHAPQTVAFQVDENTNFETRFPVTKATDWCGDYRQA